MLFISLPNIEIVEIRQDLWHCKNIGEESNNQQLLQLKRNDLSAKIQAFLQFCIVLTSFSTVP